MELVTSLLKKVCESDSTAKLIAITIEHEMTLARMSESHRVKMRVQDLLHESGIKLDAEQFGKFLDI